ncbi:MAG: AbrB/MazE/SpoVT family DNA-binding domain-containing protein [Candidatus Korarchaeota archaeon]|nr:AbrB/MazE/SpoVT family DNA-binding domain-containing protein [Candidatus Korarchaeota archaeon]
MSVVEVRVGRRRTIVIPKKIAQSVGIEEGTLVAMKVEGEKIIIEPKKDAVWLALHGKKVAKVTLEKLEEESLERQEETGRAD